MKHLLILALVFSSCKAIAQNQDSITIRKIYDEALMRGSSYHWLRQLTKNVGPRLSGSEGAAKAVQWGKAELEKLGLDRVFLQDVMVPHWVRGAKEEAYILNGKQKINVSLVALGGSVATPKTGLIAEIIEVKSIKELQELGKEKCQGKIIFYNRPMDATKINTFEAYGGAGDQRRNGATEAAKVGAIGAIIRSLSSTVNDFPHTGSMAYGTGVPMIPAGAISTSAAEQLSALLKQNPSLKFYFKQNCETLPDAPSHNVIGEIRGSEKPDEIIVVGGHLDSWDLAEGAHDDGTGCVQSMEVLRIMKALGIRPKRTIRVVLFMNEENGLKGGIQYAQVAKNNNENHIFALESDSGGFTPKGFGVQGANDKVLSKIESYKPLFEPYGLHEIGKGSGGADIGPMAIHGTVLIGFKPDSQRYFDYHHANNDRFEAVNQRELELGAAAMSSIIYLLDKNGL